jgi:hypothetical protein
MLAILFDAGHPVRCWPGRSAGDQLGAELLLGQVDASCCCWPGRSAEQLLDASLLAILLLLASAVHSAARPSRTVQMRR